jgi:hypothetical protein
LYPSKCKMQVQSYIQAQLHRPLLIWKPYYGTSHEPSCTLFHPLQSGGSLDKKMDGVLRGLTEPYIHPSRHRACSLLEIYMVHVIVIQAVIRNLAMHKLRNHLLDLYFPDECSFTLYIEHLYLLSLLALWFRLQWSRLHYFVQKKYS